MDLNTLIKNKAILIPAIIATVLLCGIGYLLMHKQFKPPIDVYAAVTVSPVDEKNSGLMKGDDNENSNSINSARTNDRNETTKSITTENTTDEEFIWIHVAGMVEEPGAVSVKKGARIKDAILAAGGLKKDADMDKINLAYVLKDGQKIFVPIKSNKLSDTKTTSTVAKKPSTTSTTTVEALEVDINGIVQDKVGSTGIVSEVEIEDNSNNSASVKSKVNINTASIVELDSLPGVGPSTAEKIISFRDESGGFKKIEEIMNVPGIGQSKFNSIKDRIAVE